MKSGVNVFCFEAAWAYPLLAIAQIGFHQILVISLFFKVHAATVFARLRTHTQPLLKHRVGVYVLPHSSIGERKKKHGRINICFWILYGQLLNINNLQRFHLRILACCAAEGKAIVGRERRRLRY